MCLLKKPRVCQGETSIIMTYNILSGVIRTFKIGSVTTSVNLPWRENMCNLSAVYKHCVCVCMCVCGGNVR